MIDPEKVTNFNRTDKELEEFILFWVCAAGKNGRTAARCLDKFLLFTGGYVDVYGGPLMSIIRVGAHVPRLMKNAGIGCYTSKSKTFDELAYAVKTHKTLNLKTCTVTDLESIYGIGPKTARCFLLHSRENAQVAGLDTHMLKHLRALGYDDVPKSTPTGKKYLTLEKIVLSLAKRANMSPAEFDLWVWNKYSVGSIARRT